MRRVAPLRVVIAVALVSSGALIGAGTARAGDAAEPRPVETFLRELVDTSRPTQATTTAPASEQRVLETTIAYPTDAAEKKGKAKTLPLIVLAHGLDGHPDKFTILIEAWARAGYVVAAPEFPLTSDEAPGGSVISDFLQQPADVSFVIDEVLKMSRKKSRLPIAGLVDKERIGVAGLSLGGATTYGLVFHSCCLDERVDAVILMSAVRLSFEGTEDWRSLPAMLVHGDADGIYRVSTETYPLLAPPKWFVTLHGSTHSAPFEDSVDPADDVVPVITTEFFDHYLKGQKAAAKRLVAAVEEYGAADLVRELE